jgi:hypothetical protein
MAWHPPAAQGDGARRRSRLASPDRRGTDATPPLVRPDREHPGRTGQRSRLGRGSTR